jgi:hypothetical protein
MFSSSVRFSRQAIRVAQAGPTGNESVIIPTVVERAYLEDKLAAARAYLDSRGISDVKALIAADQEQRRLRRAA